MVNKIQIPSEVQNFLNSNEFNHTVEIGGGGFTKWEYDVYTKGRISIVPNTFNGPLSYEVHLNYLTDEWNGGPLFQGSWNDVLNFFNF